MIEVPMLETLASFWLTEHLFGGLWKPERGTMGYDRIINKYRHPFETMDGYVCALPYTDAHWVEFFTIVDRPDLAKDPRFSDRTVRPKHFSELYQVLGSILEHRPTGEWLEMFDKADIPAMPVRTLEELLDDPHLAAHHALITSDDAGQLVVQALPSINGVRLGEHSVAIGSALSLPADGLLSLGASRIRIRRAGEALAPEKPLARVNATRWLSLGLLAVALWPRAVLVQVQASAEATASGVVSALPIGFAFGAGVVAKIME